MASCLWRGGRTHIVPLRACVGRLLSRAAGCARHPMACHGLCTQWRGGNRLEPIVARSQFPRHRFHRHSELRSWLHMRGHSSCLVRSWCNITHRCMVGPSLYQAHRQLWDAPSLSPSTLLVSEGASDVRHCQHGVRYESCELGAGQCGPTYDREIARRSGSRPLQWCV